MNDFYKGKSVLVTGSDGFIGSHLTEALVKAGANVRAFVYYNSFGNWGWLDTISEETKSKLDIFAGDIRDSHRVHEAVEGQDVVFHLSSLIAIPYSYHAPDSYVQTNITGALNVLNACRTLKTKRVINTSTSEVYGTALYAPIDEKHSLQGQSPYSASKIGADMMADSFYRSFNVPVVIARPFNTYGPRQSARAVIPTIISQIASGAKEIKLGSLHPLRDFNYVLDTVSGFLSLGACDQAIGEVVNIGSGREISIGDLVQLIVKLSGKDIKVISEDSRQRPEKSEVNRLLCDASKLNRLTGWTPEHTLEQGLTETIKWISDNLQYFRTTQYAV